MITTSDAIKVALNYLYTSAKTESDFYVLGAKSALYFNKEWTRLKTLVNSDQQLSAMERCELNELKTFFMEETAIKKGSEGYEAFKSGRLDLLNGFINVKKGALRNE